MLIGACDEKLLGKKFSEGKFILDVCKEFYEGEKITKKIFARYLELATIANLVGKETIQCAIDMGLVDPSCILKISGIPHAQMVRML